MRFQVESGLSSEIARRIGTYSHTVWRWTEGVVRPDVNHMMALLALAGAPGLGHLTLGGRKALGNNACKTGLTATTAITQAGTTDCFTTDATFIEGPENNENFPLTNREVTLPAMVMLALITVLALCSLERRPHPPRAAPRTLRTSLSELRYSSGRRFGVGRCARGRFLRRSVVPEPPVD